MIHKWKSNNYLLGLFLVIIFILFTIHKFIFKLNHLQTNNFNYTIEEIYIIFSSFSLIILFIIIKVREKNLEIVGNTFLLLTTFKMIASYILAVPILKHSNTLEKGNYIVLFMLFLALETIITIILLNKNSKTI